MLHLLGHLAVQVLRQSGKKCHHGIRIVCDHGLQHIGISGSSGIVRVSVDMI